MTQRLSPSPRSSAFLRSSDYTTIDIPVDPVRNVEDRLNIAKQNLKIDSKQQPKSAEDIIIEQINKQIDELGYQRDRLDNLLSFCISNMYTFTIPSNIEKEPIAKKFEGKREEFKAEIVKLKTAVEKRKKLIDQEIINLESKGKECVEKGADSITSPKSPHTIPNCRKKSQIPKKKEEIEEVKKELMDMINERAGENGIVSNVEDIKFIRDECKKRGFKFLNGYVKQDNTLVSARCVYAPEKKTKVVKVQPSVESCLASGRSYRSAYTRKSDGKMVKATSVGGKKSGSAKSRSKKSPRKAETKESCEAKGKNLRKSYRIKNGINKGKKVASSCYKSRSK